MVPALDLGHVRDLAETTGGVSVRNGAPGGRLVHAHTPSPNADALRIVQIVASVGEQAAGPSYSVPRLCTALTMAGGRVRLLSVGRPAERIVDGYGDLRFGHDIAAVPGAGRLRLSAGLHRALRAAAAEADVIHNHGLWLMPNVYAGSVARRAGRPLVISPRGMLAPAALVYSAHAKRAFWRLFQARAVRAAACLHATSEQEFLDIRAYGLAQPVAVIPNGIDLPDRATLSEPPEGNRTLLYLGRLHHKKGVDLLLEAWARLEARHPSWRLRLVGPGERGYGEALATQAADSRLVHVDFAGPLYDAEKAAAYRDAELFVLPTRNENFAMTVAEALAAATPVICTRGAPWAGLAANGCGWWIDHGADALAATLDQAMTLPRNRLGEMGERGRAWMARDFSWDHVAREMLSVYRWLVDGGLPPPCVRVE